MVRDRIVFATNSTRVREKLLCQGADLTLEKAIDIARSHELAQQQLKSMGQSSKAHETVHEISRRANASYRRDVAHTPLNANFKRESYISSAAKACSYCGGLHGANNICPAKGKQCIKCKKLNHFAKVCKSSSQAPTRYYRGTVHPVGENAEDLTEETDLHFDNISMLDWKTQSMLRPQSSQQGNTATSLPPPYTGGCHHKACRSTIF